MFKTDTPEQTKPGNLSTTMKLIIGVPVAFLLFHLTLLVIGGFQSGQIWP